MESNRVLLSDKHFHTIELSEQAMGVICHALSVLAVAYGLEPQYLGIILHAKQDVAEGIKSRAIVRNG